MVNKMCSIYREKKVKKKVGKVPMVTRPLGRHKLRILPLGNGGLFHQRSYDRWKKGSDWRGREGEPGRGESGRGREAWACGLGHRLSNFFKLGPLTCQRA